MKKYIKPLMYCYHIHIESLMVASSLPVVSTGDEKIEESDQVLTKPNHTSFDLWRED